MSEFQKIILELLLKLLLIGAIFSILLGMYKSFTDNMIKTSEENRIKLEQMRKEQQERQTIQKTNQIHNRKKDEQKRTEENNKQNFNNIMCWEDQNGKRYYTNTVPSTDKFIKPCPDMK